MKIIEAMKQVKKNKEKIGDLQAKIAKHCCNYQHETTEYGSDTRAKVEGWLQSCEDLTRENVQLLERIQFTNISTVVSIELGGQTVSHSIAYWVWRVREYRAIDETTWRQLTDRNLQEGVSRSSTDVPFELKLVRHYDPEVRDKRLEVYRGEKFEIDSALEVVNATTDLLPLPIT